jgi:hypothetical protein
MDQILTIISSLGNRLVNTIRYVSGILDSLRKKTFTAMAKARGVSHDQVRRELLGAIKEIPELRAVLKQDVRIKVSKTPGGGALIVDTTRALKEHAHKIEGLTKEYGSSCKEWGITVAAFEWTDMAGRTLPVDLVIPSANPGFQFKTLLERAISLAQQLGVSKILADALFASIHAFTLLEKTKTLGVMRFHSNRVVNIEGFAGSFQLRHHPAFKFSRNERCIVREVSWNQLNLRVIALKLPHSTKKWRTLFLVTNASFERAKEFAAYYKFRWKIEPTFRTVKQSFGLSDSQARSIKMQEAHFFASFLAYRIQSQKEPQAPPIIKRSKRLIPISRKTRSLSPKRTRSQRMSPATA